MTGLVKSFAVTPLVCSVLPTRVFSPVVVNTAIRVFTFVAYGTVTVTAVPAIIAVAAGLLIENEVRSFELELTGVFPPLLPLHPAAAINAKTERKQRIFLIAYFDVVPAAVFYNRSGLIIYLISYKVSTFTEN